MGEKWPGICTDMKRGWPKIKGYLPEFMNLLDKPVLERALNEAGFVVDEIKYTPISHPEFSLDGREGIGFVATKIK